MSPGPATRLIVESVHKVIGEPYGSLSPGDLLCGARGGNYAIGYFESWSLESTRAVVEAAKETGSPVVIGFNGGILSVPKRTLRAMAAAIYMALWSVVAELSSVPISVLLNEIRTLQMALENSSARSSLKYTIGSKRKMSVYGSAGRL